MLYEIIITHRGVPCETWEAEANSRQEAIDVCRANRVINDEHDLHDVYDAVPAHVLTDDEAYDLALCAAAVHMPSLLDRARLLSVRAEQLACT